MNKAAGLVDDLGGAVLAVGDDTPGIAPQWAQLDFVTLTSTGTGPVTFTARIIPFALENTEPLPGQVDFDSITLNAAANRPTVVDKQTFSVPENSANGTVVGTIVVTDPDAGDTRSFAVTGGTGQTAFAVSASTGVITVADRAQLDFETRPSFTLDAGDGRRRAQRHRGRHDQPDRRQRAAREHPRGHRAGGGRRHHRPRIS